MNKFVRLYSADGTYSREFINMKVIEEIIEMIHDENKRLKDSPKNNLLYAAQIINDVIKKARKIEPDEDKRIP